jgi:zinc transporter ZupT
VTPIDQVLLVFLYALLTAVATGLGALPFFWSRMMSRRWLGYSQGIAAGLMLAASFQLIQEGLVYSTARSLAGLLLGLAFIWLSQRWLNGRQELSVGDLRGADATRALLILGVMTLHSFAEGIGVGVSFGGGRDFGLFVSLAIAVHNIPEGLAISCVLVPRGMRVAAAAGWSIISSLPQPLIAVPSFLFVEAFGSFLPVGLGLAAGAMIWMVGAEILPEADEQASPRGVATAMTLAIAAMVAFQVLIHH